MVLTMVGDRSAGDVEYVGKLRGRDSPVKRQGCVGHEICDDRWNAGGVSDCFVADEPRKVCDLSKQFRLKRFEFVHDGI